MSSQADIKKGRLFKGFNDFIQMQNFVVFHLFPVLDVPANE